MNWGVPTAISAAPLLHLVAAAAADCQLLCRPADAVQQQAQQYQRQQQRVQTSPRTQPPLNLTPFP